MLNLELKPTRYANYYALSNGNIYSVTSNSILKTYKINSGYPTIKIDNKNVLVHRIIAEAFIPNPKNLPYVNHKDGNKLNNSVDNLEWCDNSHNILHARKTGLNPYNKPTLGLKLTGHRQGTSKYYGVCFDKSRNKWRSSIRIDNKIYGQKRFDTEIEAARHYNELVYKFKLKDRPVNDLGNSIKCLTTISKESSIK